MKLEMNGKFYNKRKEKIDECPTMKSIQKIGELEQLYKKLQEEWDAYKQSNPKTTRSRRYSHSVDRSNTIKAIQLLHSSPRHLMAKLQQHSSTTNDLAVQEIIQERREAIERGRLKGRCLFHSTDTESELDFLNNLRGQDSEVRSLSFSASEDDEHENETYQTRSSYSSSSSAWPCLSHDFAGKERVDMVAMLAEKKVANGYVIRPGIENGARFIVFLGGIAIALLLIYTVCMKLTTSVGGYQEILVPT